MSPRRINFIYNTGNSRNYKDNNTKVMIVTVAVIILITIIIVVRACSSRNREQHLVAERYIGGFLRLGVPLKGFRDIWVYIGFLRFRVKGLGFLKFRGIFLFGSPHNKD